MTAAGIPTPVAMVKVPRLTIFSPRCKRNLFSTARPDEQLRTDDDYQDLCPNGVYIQFLAKIRDSFNGINVDK